MKKIITAKSFFLLIAFITVKTFSHLIVILNPASLSLTMFLVASQLYSLGFSQTFNLPQQDSKISKPSSSSTSNIPTISSQNSIITKKYEDFLGDYKPQQLNSKGSPQYEYRAFMYNQNIQTINSHNENNNKRYIMGLNSFTDISPNQFTVRFAKLVIPDNYQELKKIKIPFPIKPPPTPTSSSSPPPISPPPSYFSPPSSHSSPSPPPPTLPTDLFYLPQFSEYPIIMPAPQRRLLLEYNNQINSYYNNKQVSINSNFYSQNEKSTSISSVSNKKQLYQQNDTVSPLFIPISILSYTQNNTNSFSSYSQSTSIKSVTRIAGQATNAKKDILQNGTIHHIYTTPPNITIDWSCLASNVLNQGICGACYAIAALQSIYITLQIQKIKTVKPLSVQQIIACADKHKNSKGGGCAGGYFYYTFDYVIKDGVGRQSMYPYTSQSQSSSNIQCNTNIINSNIYNVSRLRIRDRGFINTGDCYSLVKKLTTHALAVTISTTGFQFYIQGTYNNQGQPPNHGVTLVGYDPINGYKIKNSWGKTWGMVGYAYVSQTTGVCDYSMFPITGYQRLPRRKPC